MISINTIDIKNLSANWDINADHSFYWQRSFLLNRATDVLIDFKELIIDHRVVHMVIDITKLIEIIYPNFFITSCFLKPITQSSVLSCNFMH